MDNDLQGKISAILSNPEGLEKIMSIAKSLNLGDLLKGKEGNGPQPESEPKPESPPPKEDVQAEAIHKNEGGIDLSGLEALYRHGKDERLALLKAIRPYIKKDKQNKMDGIISAMKTIDLIYSAKDIL